MVETIPQYVVEEDEGTVFYMGAHAYVPRLVQANVPWQRPAMPSLKYSTKRDTGGSLRTLGGDTYAPSGIPLKPEDLMAGPKPTQQKDGISVGTLGGAKQVWKAGAFKGVPDSTDPLKSLVEMLDRKKQAAERDAETARKLHEQTAKLSPQKREVRKSVIDRKLVVLDAENHRLIFSKHLEFEPRHHGADNSAKFKNEAEATMILKDAASLLEVYDTAQVVVEGHTATPASKLDAWAQQLAQNRAEKVKATLESMGVKASRLTAVGRPGKQGTGLTEVILKITDL